MAPFFDMAFGVGIGAVVAALPTLPSLVSVVLLGPLLAVAFIRLPMFFASQLNASLLVVAPCVMALVVVLALMTWNRTSRSSSRHDSLLVVAPLLFQLYWAAFTWRCAAIPAELKVVVLSLSIAAFLVWGAVGSSKADSASAGGKELRTYSSWLDSVQQDAQASELEPANTNWRAFVLLAVVQLPVLLALARYWEVPDFLAYFPIGSHFLGFLVAANLIGSCKYFDMWGEATFFTLYLWSYGGVVRPTPRHQLLMACQLLWVLRLGCFLGWRIFVRGSDFRFDKLMTAPAYNCFGWISQGTWIFLQGSCTWALNHRQATSAPLGAMDCLGAAVVLVGLVVEHTADMQKTRWNAKTPSGKQTTFCQDGLWKYSRHPNFFGENVVHLGLALICLSGLPTWGLWAIALVSPVWSCFFLVFTSLMLLEKRMLTRHGHLPAYKEYIATTSVLVPWPLSAAPKTSAPSKSGAASPKASPKTSPVAKASLRSRHASPGVRAGGRS